MTNNIADRPSGYDLERRLAHGWPVQEWCDTHVVLAVSGGADSVALLRAMAALKKEHGGLGKLYVVHLNHGMRGSAADADESWVRSLCERLTLPVDVTNTDVATIAADQGDGWEAAARSARYDFLRAVAERIGGRFVVTAHTANDQVETVLHRILRGTGIEGLSGIARARPLTSGIALVRPMLEITRSDVLAYLAAIGQDFRTDATNQDTQWTRNRLRHELLPHLRECYNQRVDEALSRLALQAAEVQYVIAELATPVAAQCVVFDCSRTQLDCDKLKGHPPVVVREVFKLAWRQAGWPEQSMGFAEWHQLASLAADGSCQWLNLPGNIRAHREGHFIQLAR